MEFIGGTPQIRNMGQISVTTYRVSPRINAFALPEQWHPGKYHLYILPEQGASFRDLGEADRSALNKLLAIPQIQYTTIAYPEGGAPNEDFRHETIKVAGIADTEDVYVAPFRPDYLSEFDSFHWYSWTQHPQVVNPVLTGDYGEILPVTAEIIPTMNCSYRCGIDGNGPGCSYTDAKRLLGLWDAPNRFNDPGVHMLSWDTMKTVIDKLISAGVLGLIFTGGGEPILNELTVPGIRYAREAGADVELFSNGSILTPEIVQEIVRARLQIVRISMNAGTEEGHRCHHNYLNPEARHFGTVLKALEYFAREKAATGSPQNFGVAYLVSNRNRNNLATAAQILLSIIDKHPGGIDFVSVRPEIDYFGRKKTTPEIILEEAEAIKEFAPEFENRGVAFSYFFRIPTEGRAEKGYSQCRALRMFGEVGPSGEMFQCCDRNGHPHYKVGNLLSHSIYEIWHSSEYQALLDKMNKAALSICPPVCKPHVFNLIFEGIEQMRAQGRISEVEDWIKAQQETLPKHRFHNLL